MWIGQLLLVTDLAEGERAYPESDVAYQLQTDGPPKIETTVEYVERRGAQLIARGTDGRDYTVSGHAEFELKTVRKWLRT